MKYKMPDDMSPYQFINMIRDYIYKGKTSKRPSWYIFWVNWVLASFNLFNFIFHGSLASLAAVIFIVTLGVLLERDRLNHYEKLWSAMVNTDKE